MVHYLGVIAPLLLGQPAGSQDRDHKVRFGIGAGVEPTLHAAFEERFGFPAGRGLGHDRVRAHPDRQ